MTLRRHCLIACSTLLVLAGAARACPDHEDPAVGRDRLAAHYPGALDVLPAIAAARREKLLPAANPLAAMFADRFPLQRHLRLIEHFEQRVNGAPDGVFSLVLIEPMLWTRFAPGTGPEIHSPGPHPGELVVVSGEDVIGAIGEGRLSIAQAHGRGLLGLHGEPAQVAWFLHKLAAVSP